jgi:FMN phosphatase YigB (HAD superfamily)
MDGCRRIFIRFEPDGDRRQRLKQIDGMPSFPKESLDVFDTLLTRRLLQPTDLFLILGRKLASLKVLAIDGATFCERRQKAEEISRQNDAGRETTLLGIYETFCRLGTIPEQLAARFMELELELEAQMLCPVPGAAALLKQRRQAGSGLWFVSDMYLPAKFIQQQLERFGFYLPGDKIFVSCEHKANKYSGALFQKILLEEGIRSGQLRHTGNDPRTDGQSPQNLGVAVDLRPYPPAYGDARFFLEARVATGGLSSVIGASARLAQEQFEADDALGRLGAAMAGPALVGYVLWLLQDARARRIHRLYFVARDGELLLEIARRLCGAEFPDIELKYLHGSRKAWHLPSLRKFGARELSWLLLQDPIVNLPIVAGRLGLSAAVARQELVKLLPETEILSAIWSQQTIEILKSRLTELGPANPLLSAAREQRDITLDFFRQEGLLDDVSLAFVDLGWVGTMQTSFDLITRELRGAKTTVAYHFGQVGQDPYRDKLASVFPFAFNPDDSSEGRSAGGKLLELMEVFCSSGDGMTSGYRREGRAKIVPVFKEQPANLNRHWNRDRLRQGVFTFCDELSDAIRSEWSGQLAEPGSRLVWRKLIVSLLERLADHPSPAEAGALGRYRFSSDSSEMFYRELAPKLTVMDGICILLGDDRERRLITLWLAGAVARSGKLSKYLLIGRGKRLVFGVCKRRRVKDLVLKSARTLKRIRMRLNFDRNWATARS